MEWGLRPPSYFSMTQVLVNQQEPSLLGASHPQLPGYKLVKKDRYKSLYTKVDPLTRTGSYIEFDRFTKEVRVGKVMDPEVVKATVALNKEAQNTFDGYRGKEMVRQYAVPEMIDQQLKQQAGLEERTGLYDRGKYLALLDDSDNKYLKTVPHKISGRKREI